MTALGTLGVLVVFYLLGLALAANLKTCATFAGNYLIGRRHFRWMPEEHRRELEMRGIGVGICVLAALYALAIPFSRSVPGWATMLGTIIGGAPPVALWMRTTGVHGTEIDDSAGSKTFWRR